MKISDVKVTMYTIPFPEGHTWGSGATGRQSAWNSVVVHVFTDEGISGVGESFHQNNPEPVAERIEKICKPLVIGLDPFDREKIWERLFFPQKRSGREAINAISGIDIALWDIMGKVTGLPIFKLLGGGTNDRVKPYCGGWTMGMRQPSELDSLVEEGMFYIKQGYKALKLAGGRSRLDYMADVESVKALRKAVGPEIPLMLDVKWVYDESTVLKLARALEPYDLFWLESAVGRGSNLFGAERVAEVASKVSMPIATGGSVYSRFELRRLISCGFRGVIMLNVAKTGGFTDAMKTAAICSAWELPISAQGIGSALNFMQAAHFQAAAPPHVAQDMYFEIEPIWPMKEFLTNPPRIEDGFFILPQEPGLGTDVREDAAERFPFKRPAERIRDLVPPTKEGLR